MEDTHGQAVVRALVRRKALRLLRDPARQIHCAMVAHVSSDAGHSGTTSTSTRTMWEPPPLRTPISGLTSE